MFSESQICCNTTTFCRAAIFVKYWYTTGSGCYNSCVNLPCSGCSPLGEKLLWKRTIDLSSFAQCREAFMMTDVHCYSYRSRWPPDMERPFALSVLCAGSPLELFCKWIFATYVIIRYLGGSWNPSLTKAAACIFLIINSFILITWRC